MGQIVTFGPWGLLVCTQWTLLPNTQLLLCLISWFLRPYGSQRAQDMLISSYIYIMIFRSLNCSSIIQRKLPSYSLSLTLPLFSPFAWLKVKTCNTFSLAAVFPDLSGSVCSPSLISVGCFMMSSKLKWSKFRVASFEALPLVDLAQCS